MRCHKPYGALFLLRRHQGEYIALMQRASIMQMPLLSPSITANCRVTFKASTSPCTFCNLTSKSLSSCAKWYFVLTRYESGFFCCPCSLFLPDPFLFQTATELSLPCCQLCCHFCLQGFFLIFTKKKKKDPKLPAKLASWSLRAIPLTPSKVVILYIKLLQKRFSRGLAQCRPIFSDSSVVIYIGRKSIKKRSRV